MPSVTFMAHTDPFGALICHPLVSARRSVSREQEAPHPQEEKAGGASYEKEEKVTVPKNNRH